MNLMASNVFILFLFDLIFLGPFGLEIFQLSTRKLIFASLIMYGIYNINKYKLIDRAFIYVCIFLLSILIWAVLIPLLVIGNIDNSFSELKGYVWFLIIPIIYFLFRNNQQDKILKFFIVFMKLFSSVVIILWILAEFFDKPEYAYTFRFLMGSLNGERTEPDNLFIGPIDDGSFRVMWVTSIFLPLSTYLTITHRTVTKLNKIITILIFSGAVLASGTRSLIFSQIVLLVYFYFNYNKTSLRRLIFGGFSFILSAAILFFSIHNSERRVFEFKSEFELGGPRIDQFHALLNLFMKNPIFGNGLGSFANDLIRNESAPFSYELVYIALLAKLGIVGFLIIAVFSFLYIYYKLIAFNNHKTPVLVAYIFITSTNPYLATPHAAITLGFILFIGVTASMKISTVKLI